MALPFVSWWPIHSMGHTMVVPEIYDWSAGPRSLHPQVVSWFYLAWMYAKTAEERLDARRGEAAMIGRPMVGCKPLVAQGSGENNPPQEAEKVKEKAKGKRKLKLATPKVPMTVPKPTSVVFREPRAEPSKAKTKRSNTCVRTEGVKPSKFERYKDNDGSSSSTPMEKERKDSTEEPFQNDNAMAE